MLVRSNKFAMYLPVWYCVLRSIFLSFKTAFSGYKSSSDPSTTNILLTTHSGTALQHRHAIRAYFHIVYLHELQMRIGSMSVNAIKSMEFNTTYELGPASRLLCK